MKNLIITFLIVFVSIRAIAQETYFTKFYIKDSIQIAKNKYVKLKKDKKFSFQELNRFKQMKFRELILKNRGGELSVETSLGSKTIKRNIKIPSYGNINFDELFKGVKFDSAVAVSPKKKRKAYVKFEKEKIIVNPWLIKDSKGEYNRETYYYKLKNRQKTYLTFNEWSLSALTIPLKYRFKNDDDGLKEQFNTSFNANLFIGYTIYGRRSFFYRKGVGNRSNDFKMTLGAFLGASTVKLNNSNTNLANEPIADDTEITEGLASYGLGVNLSFNKLNFGVFTGWDKSVGENSEKWNYNNRTWLGLAIGYSLLKI